MLIKLMHQVIQWVQMYKSRKKLFQGNQKWCQWPENVRVKVDGPKTFLSISRI